eukprot:COSAG05_NODE_250_length_12887_cov_28.030810_15_plen_65_part_01
MHRPDCSHSSAYGRERASHRHLAPRFHGNPTRRSVREPPSEVLISDPKVNQPKQARRPRMRIQRA